MIASLYLIKSGDPVGDGDCTGGGLTDGGPTDGGPTDGPSGDGGFGDQTQCSLTPMVVNCGCVGSGCANDWHPVAECGNSSNYSPGAQFASLLECYPQGKSMSKGLSKDCPEEDIIIVDEETVGETPCENLNNITIDNSQNRLKFKQLLTSNENNEEAFKMGKDPTTGLDVSGEIFEAQGDCTEITIRTNGLTYAAVHTHPQGGEGCNPFGMFSGGDILQLAQIANSYNQAGSDDFNTFSFFLTYNGKAFAIKFDNQEALETLTDLYNDNFGLNFQKQFEKKYQKLERQFGQTASQNQLMRTMYDILGEFDLEISLYEATVDGQHFITDWNKINKETLAQEVCN